MPQAPHPTGAMSLLEDLKTVSATITPSETPSAGDIPTILGGLLKVLEHNGTTVADELLDDATADVTPTVEADASHVEDRVKNLEQRLEAFLQKVGA